MTFSPPQYIRSQSALANLVANAPTTPVAGPKDKSNISGNAQEAAAAVATTARRDARLADLQQGPIQLNGLQISQQDGFKALSNDSWDRFNSAFEKVPKSTRQGVQDQFSVVASDWASQPGNAERFQRMSPEMQQEYKWQWQAQAAADGGRQYVQARAGYLLSGGAPGQ